MLALEGCAYRASVCCLLGLVPLADMEGKVGQLSAVITVYRSCQNLGHAIEEEQVPAMTQGTGTRARWLASICSLSCLEELCTVAGQRGSLHRKRSI